MTEQKEKKLVEFYGGVIGPWLPIICMILCIAYGTYLGNGGLVRMVIITFVSLMLGFVLAKDKKHFGEIAFSGLKNHMLSIIIVAFLLAGVMGQLLRQSGLIDTLVYLIAKADISVGLLPLASFLICAVISTSCGTSSGSAAAAAPLMMPLAAELDMNVGLVAGAVIAGAIFGDNLAPISDTTIGSALTQEADIGAVVRTRLPYSLIAGGLSAILYMVFGMKSAGEGTIDVPMDSANLLTLAMLIMPVLMIIMIKKGFDLVSTLLVCNLTGIVLGIALGCIPAGQMFANEGPIGAGLSGMMTLIIYCILIFMILEILNVSGAFETMMNGFLKMCKTPRSGELAGMLMTAITTVAAGGSSPAIIFCGPMVRNVAKAFKIEKTRGANILDGTACGVTGLLPYGSCMMLCLGIAEGITPEGFNFTDIVPYCFHSMFLLLLFFLSVMTGIGRRFEK